MMNANLWLVQLHQLLERHSALGIQADIANMNQTELWGVYRFLRRLEGEKLP